MSNRTFFVYVAATLRAVRVIVPMSTLMAQPIHGGSATWNLSPISNDWNTAANWTPAVVPDQEADLATFGVSSVTDISTSSVTGVGGIVFAPDANPYRIVASFAFFGVGVVNNSGVTQNFDNSQGFAFVGTATAGDNVVYTTSGETISDSAFAENSNAGSATFVNKGAYLVFYNNTSAANGTILNEEGGTGGGRTDFLDDSTAGDSAVTTQPNCTLKFGNNATGGASTLLADGGTIYFEEKSNGNLARVELVNGSLLDLTKHNNASLMAIGSLEGDSLSTVRLSTQTLTVGGNGLSTTFAGVITSGGSLVKTGGERLILSGASTYTGGTTVSAGILQVNNRTGSATGAGAVRVNGGTLGGKGIIAGAVTVGTGSGSGAFLNPGSTRPDTLTLSKPLAFKGDGTYQCDLSLGQAKADQVSANGVTIESGAQFVFLPKGIQRLTRGTVFTVINNTATTPISGTFANLADGSKLSTGAGNKLRVSYAGGDGNDLTLTVVQ